MLMKKDKKRFFPPITSDIVPKIGEMMALINNDRLKPALQ